jgi:hypothetical protein
MDPNMDRLDPRHDVAVVLVLVGSIGGMMCLLGIVCVEVVVRQLVP